VGRLSVRGRSYYTLMGSGCRWKWLRYKAWRSWQQWQGTPAGDQPWARTTVATVQGMGMDEKARHRQAFEQADTDGNPPLHLLLRHGLGSGVGTMTVESVVVFLLRWTVTAFRR
jgi:hypothetical protein